MQPASVIDDRDLYKAIHNFKGKTALIGLTLKQNQTHIETYVHHNCSFKSNRFKQVNTIQRNSERQDCRMDLRVSADVFSMEVLRLRGSALFANPL